jgi:dihydroorotate dehydrogenase
VNSRNLRGRAIPVENSPIIQQPDRSLYAASPASAGLSGPAIKPIAWRLVYQAPRAVKIPVIGLGGMASGEDAAGFPIAGAGAVEVGTVTFRGPRSPLRVAEAHLLHHVGGSYSFPAGCNFENGLVTRFLST